MSDLREAEWKMTLTTLVTSTLFFHKQTHLY
jgi:hypothetical protein